jgi:hypothetical protein
MTEFERNFIRAALIEARGALRTIATSDNQVGNTILMVEQALGKLAGVPPPKVGPHERDTGRPARKQRSKA